jgi:hypothetical protein
MNHKNLMLNKIKLIMASLFILLAIFGFINIYLMSAIQNLYPGYLLVFVLVLSMLLFASGIGLLLMKKWAFYTFVGFSLFFVALAVVSQFGLLKQNWVSFFTIFLVLCVLFAFTGRYVKLCVERLTSDGDTHKKNKGTV